MKVFAVAALAGIALAAPQGVTSAVSPTASAPASCATNYPGDFEISVVNVSSSSTKRDLSKRKALTITLKDGVLTDDEGRTGYIASNNQFQFDKPAQAGAIYTSGWSVCSNGTLALGDSAVFYQCLSGTFYNLYDESTGNQCSQIFIDVINDSTSSGAEVSSAADGQVTASSAPAVTQITDGQIQATTATADPITQISDGQIQATTATADPVTQISDGQIQATTAAAIAVSQISDGQIQATTAAANPVSQISDGQIQATTAAANPVSQISDGQIQATSVGTVSVVAGITNGTTLAAASANPTATTYTGAAAFPTFGGEMLLAAGAIAIAML